MPADRFSTATRLRALGSQAAERVYRAQNRRMRTPPGSRLTGRAAVLALVVCSLVVVLAYPARQYFSQRAQIAEQREQSEEAREAVKRLREERARWDDPAYVEQQARLHLHYVRPGESSYIRRDGTADDERADDTGPADRPWYQNFWRSIDLTDSAD